MTVAEHTTIAVIGGGLVGLSIAYGLNRLGKDVIVIDTAAAAAPAYRANFGLIWTQTKGLAFRPYASLSRQAASLWPQFAQKIETVAETEIGIEMKGGVKLCQSSEEMDVYQSTMTKQFEADLPMHDAYARLSASEVKDIIPDVGPGVAGGFLCRLDGAVNPIRFYTALRIALHKNGTRMMFGCSVTDILEEGSGYRLVTSAGPVTVGKVVLAAGLGNRALGEKAGISLPITPIRGQILVTQRLQPFIDLPTHVIRQTSDNSVIIGDSKEDVDTDDGNDISVMGDIARRAIAVFPRLADVSIVRAWGGLRIMTPDGSPVYTTSRRHPGIFAVNVHSGVTLAPVHAGPVAEWIAGSAKPLMGGVFEEGRFHAKAA